MLDFKIFTRNDGNGFRAFTTEGGTGKFIRKATTAAAAAAAISIIGLSTETLFFSLSRRNGTSATYNRYFA